MRTLSQRASFWTCAAVAALALWTSGAPTVMYPLYAAEWQLTPVVTTLIFAIYPLVLVIVLIVFGDVSDHIGRRATILIGLGLMIVGILLFAVAPSVWWVLVGRAFMGFGVGLSLSPATAAMVEFSAAGQSQRASSITTASTAAGLTLSILVSGALVQYAPDPTHLSFWLLLVVVVAVLLPALMLPRGAGGAASTRWRPRAITVPRGLRGVFAASALAVAAAYSIGALWLSLGAQVSRQLLATTNSFVIGVVLCVASLTIGVVAIVARRLPPRVLISAGCAVALIGLADVILAAAVHSLPLFLLSGIITGAGYSLLFLGGLSLVSAHSPAHHRAGILSAVYLVAYLVQGVTALALGASATSSGLTTALDAGAPVIAAVGVAALVLAITVGRPRISPSSVG